MSPPLDRSADRTALFALTVALALLATAGVAAHALSLNGPRGWYWRWRELPPLFVAACLAPAFVGVAAVHRRWILGTEAPRIGRALVALVLCCIALQLGALHVEPLGLKRLHTVVLSRTATSYYTDALNIEDAASFLASFHTASLTAHSATHPPGPILFYYGFIALFGTDIAPYAAAGAVMVLSALVLPVFYFATAPWLHSSRARLVACSFYALAPTIIVFIPALDTIFALAALALAACWQRALEEVSTGIRWKLATGAALFLATLLAYNVLAIGVLMLMLAASRVLSANDRRRAVTEIAIAAAVSLMALVVLHLAFHALTGYRPIASFRHALDVQAHELGRLHRAYLPSIFVDLYGFFVLGAGAVAAPLIVAGVAESLRRKEGEPRTPPYALIGVAAVLIVDLTGLLPGESARVWAFLYPFVLLPMGIAVADLAPRRQLALLAVQWLFLATVKANILFVSPY